MATTPPSSAADPGFLSQLLIDFDAPLALRIVLLLLALPMLAIAGRWLQTVLRKHRGEQSALLARKALVYCGTVIILITLLGQLGLQIGPLLGAIGLAGVAIGFASQTSLSNIISGLFLLADRPFKVGDFISVDGSSGIVIEIDLLSIKIRNFDNRVIRIPNEVAIKAKLENITRYPIRRLDTTIRFRHDSDIDLIRKTLQGLCERLPLILAEPESIILFKEIDDIGLVFFVGIWIENEDFLKARNALMDAIVKDCRTAGLQFAKPPRLIETQGGSEG